MKIIVVTAHATLYKRKKNNNNNDFRCLLFTMVSVCMLYGKASTKHTNKAENPKQKNEKTTNIAIQNDINDS